MNDMYSVEEELEESLKREEQLKAKITELKKEIQKHVNTIIGNCDGDQLILAECNLILKEVEK